MLSVGSQSSLSRSPVAIPRTLLPKETKSIENATFDNLFGTEKTDSHLYTCSLSEPQLHNPQIALKSNTDKNIFSTTVDERKILIQTNTNEKIEVQSKKTNLDFSQNLILHPDSNAAQVKNLLNILDDIQKKVNLRQVTSDITYFESNMLIHDLLKELESTNALIFLKNSGDESAKDFLLYLLIAATNQNKFWTYFSHVGIIAKTSAMKKIIQKIKSQFAFRKKYNIGGVKCLYEGHLDENELANGQGSLTYSNGCFYEGEFENGVMQGQGKMTYPNGESYEGGFKHGKRHGVGKIRYNDGYICRVESKFDEKYSKVTEITYLDGRVYEGECKYTEEHGQGKMTYPNGNVYEGSFKNGKAHGQGKTIYPNGDIRHGIWENGILDLNKTAQIK